MRLSNLQKFILLECLNSKSDKISRGRLHRFYDTIKKGKRPKKEMVTKIITQSIKRLINKELMIGLGERTPHKWFIKEIKLMPKGRKEAKKLMGEQMSFKFKENKKRNRK